MVVAVAAVVWAVAVLLAAPVSANQPWCAHEPRDHCVRDLPYGPHDLLALFRPPPPDFVQCRDQLWSAISPPRMLQQHQVDALEDLFDHGLWDLRAKCRLADDDGLSLLHAVHPGVSWRKRHAAARAVLSDAPVVDVENPALGIEGATANDTTNIHIALDMLRLPDNVYMAGLPNFPRNFVRDSVIAALLARDYGMLVAQLHLAASRQGIRTGPLTGEEVGKMFHEFPGYPISGRWTDYNACDATALFVIGVYEAVQMEREAMTAEQQQDWRKHSPTFQALQGSVERAVYQYILPHVDARTGLFVEDPARADADFLALKVTYWKDSKLLGSKHHFPVSYSLAHAQNFRAIKLARQLLGHSHLEATVHKMRQALHSLYNKDTGLFLVSRVLGPHGEDHPGVSSDSLTTLFFLDPEDIPPHMLATIEASSAALETPIGYATETVVGLAKEHQPVMYHLNTVWPFEQGLIHQGAVRHGLRRAQRVSQRVAQILLDGTGRFPELARVQEDPEREGTVIARFLGCSPQLWSVCAAQYFLRLLHATERG